LEGRIVTTDKGYRYLNALALWALPTVDNISQKNINFENQNKYGKETSQMELGSSDTASQRNEQISNSIRERAAKAEREFAQNRNGNAKATYGEKVDAEKQAAYNYAKENNLWIADIYSLGSPFASGNENTVVLNVNDRSVYKSNNLMNAFGSINNLFKTIEAHNKLFPETSYETKHYYK
jgi:hypothetical protein